MATPKDAPYKLIQRQPPFTVREIRPGKQYRLLGSTLVRAVPKVRGKANAKRAKRARIRGRQLAQQKAV